MNTLKFAMVPINTSTMLETDHRSQPPRAQSPGVVFENVLKCAANIGKNAIDHSRLRVAAQ